MSVSKEVILITAGDPASISTEITIKAIEAKNPASEEPCLYQLINNSTCS